MLVAMAEQPVLVTPGTMQQNLLNPHNQIVPTEQEDGLQQKQEEQLSNIDLHAVNQGIDLLNKYYPGLGQVTFQPVQQLLPTNPLIARQWANVPQDFSQDQSFENDKFPDPNVQAESQVNSETQTDKINHQRATGDDTAIPLTDNHSWFGIGKYNNLYKNLIRFIVNPDDQYIGPAQDQDPGRYVCYADDPGAKRIGQMEGGGTLELEPIMIKQENILLCTKKVLPSVGDI